MLRVPALKKKPLPPSVRLVASLMALVALGSSLLAGVDPLNCLIRGAVAFIVGRSVAGFWCVIFPPKNVEKSGDPDSASSGVDVAEAADRAAA